MNGEKMTRQLQKSSGNYPASGDRMIFEGKEHEATGTVQAGAEGSPDGTPSAVGSWAAPGLDCRP